MKAIQPGLKRDWELYDLSSDISESNNIAAEFPSVLKVMMDLADAAHSPAVEGTFSDTTLHEKDRQAKYGSTRPVPTLGKVTPFDQTGLIPQKECKIASVSSESNAGNRLAKFMLDGNSRTHWHTEYLPEIQQHPHHVVIDLGRHREVTGLRYLSRQDGGFNGGIAKYEIYVSTDGKEFGKPIAVGEFARKRVNQQILFQPQQARYLKLVVLSEVNGGPWASAAELGVIGK